MFRARFGGVKITDRRVRLTTEVLQGIRLIKFYAWESFYAHQIATLREKEIRKTGVLAYVISHFAGFLFMLVLNCFLVYRRVSRAGLIVIVTVVPIFASVLSFVRIVTKSSLAIKLLIRWLLDYLRIVGSPLESRYHL